jgi:hypothetical protein
MNDDTYTRKSEGTQSKEYRALSACGAVNLRDAAEVWDVVNCSECNTLLEIMDLRPPTLDYASDDVAVEEWEEEDWDEYDKP